MGMAASCGLMLHLPHVSVCGTQDDDDDDDDDEDEDSGDATDDDAVANGASQQQKPKGGKVRPWQGHMLHLMVAFMPQPLPCRCLMSGGLWWHNVVCLCTSCSAGTGRLLRLQLRMLLDGTLCTWLLMQRCMQRTRA